MYSIAVDVSTVTTERCTGLQAKLKSLRSLSLWTLHMKIYPSCTVCLSRLTANWYVQPLGFRHLRALITAGRKVSGETLHRTDCQRQTQKSRTNWSARFSPRAQEAGCCPTRFSSADTGTDIGGPLAFGTESIIVLELDRKNQSTDASMGATVKATARFYVLQGQLLGASPEGGVVFTGFDGQTGTLPQTHTNSPKDFQFTRVYMLLRTHFTCTHMLRAAIGQTAWDQDVCCHRNP